MLCAVVMSRRVVWYCVVSVQVRCWVQQVPCRRRRSAACLSSSLRCAPPTGWSARCLRGSQRQQQQQDQRRNLELAWGSEAPVGAVDPQLTHPFAPHTSRCASGRVTCCNMHGDVCVRLILQHPKAVPSSTAHNSAQIQTYSNQSTGFQTSSSSSTSSAAAAVVGAAAASDSPSPSPTDTSACLASATLPVFSSLTQPTLCPVV